MKINDAIFGVVLFLLGAAILVAVKDYPLIPGQDFGPRLFPGVIAAGLMACGVLLGIGGARERRGASWVQVPPWLRSPPHVVAFAATLGAVVAYILLADTLGFLILAPILLTLLFLAYRVRPLRAVVVAVVVSLVIWYAFYKLLRVPLPWGLLTPYAF
jgi:putative tricarboxylic transport membrane protein